MNKFLPAYFIAVLCFFQFSSNAQEDSRGVYFANGIFLPGDNISKGNFTKADLGTVLYDNQFIGLVQFSRLPDLAQQQRLDKLGLHLDQYFPGNAYIAFIDQNFDFTAAKQFGIRSINGIPAMYKIDKKLMNLQPSFDKQEQRAIVVSYPARLDKSKVIRELIAAGAVVQATKFDAPGIVFLQVNAGIVEKLAALPFVTNLNLQALKDKSLNFNSRAAHGVSGLNALGGKNLNGKGVTLGIGDDADISTHIDFSGRLINRSGWIPSDHGTHVSGTAAGAGIINVRNHGIAPKATIINQFFSDIITNTPTYIADNNLVVSNNSYFSVDVGCPGEGEYDVLSNYVDKQLTSYKQILHVVAAGNDGNLTCSPNLPFFGTVKSGWQSAKNVLTVGAMNTEDYSIAYFSSRGPLKDGRLKPEITTGGWAVLSTNAFNTYGINFGTSMASPSATGALTLMYERYRQLHAGVEPAGALMKALICNTAEDLGNAGPDFTFGFGMLNARRAVEAIEGNRFISGTVANASATQHTVDVPANTKKLKLLLYWADTAAAVNAATALVNDLDLTVTTPDGIVHRPLVLNSNPASVETLAIEGVDHTNNIEQVEINDPLPGTYTLNIAGFSVPFGPQPYYISYEIAAPSITVEYPFGGETLVPGETENIRWTAIGDTTNRFTIQYSGNNGSTWKSLSTNVPGSSRSFAWVVPDSANNTSLIRVSRNGTPLVDQSDFNFMVLGSPAITATSACEGAVSLNWGAVQNASSYDILQLKGDSMAIIANTVTPGYLVRGLDMNQTQWFGVAAKNGTVSGRRSVSKSIIANGGPCTLEAFNNDLKVDSILTPVSGREFFSNAAGAAAPVSIRIRNLDNAVVSAPFDVSYSLNGVTYTETLNTNLAASSTVDYTFSTPYPAAAPGYTNEFKAWVTKPGDANRLNDTATKTVRLIANPAIASLPSVEGFESMPPVEFTAALLGLTGVDRADFSANSARGRARSFVNTGFAHTGNRYITLDQAPYSGSTNADSLTLSYNLSAYTNAQLRYDWYYKNHGQPNNPGNKVWIRGSESGAWVEAYDLFLNQADLGQWKHGIININEILEAATPPQTVSSSLQIRIGQEANTSANTPNPVVDIDDGYTIDDLKLDEAFNDLAATKILSPDRNGCALTAANPVSIRIKNFNNRAFNNIPVSYRINNGPVVTENIPVIGANQTLDYVFNQTSNLSAYIDYNIEVWVKNPTDNYPDNDSVLNFTIHNSPVISSFPYLERFENSNGFFYVKGYNASWAWGAPTKNVISKAANGSKAWVTGLTANYKDNETSYLYSPCFNLSGLSQPMLSFSHILELEQDFDYSWVEYSTDGVLWQKLGTAAMGTNWYEDILRNNWTVANRRWHVASVPLPTGITNIRLRFVMSSDGGVTMEGVGIDDVHIYDKEPVYTGLPLAGITAQVSGNGWVNFSSGGTRIAAVNPNGSDLGSTTVKVYPFSGPVRISSNQYYLDRNIVIQPQNPPASSVGVRFYFTDAEVQQLVDASSCGTCSKPASAYELGVTKYSGSVADENGTLDDNQAGYYMYILPANTEIVPYDNGYYAEFAVNSFSEFWLNNGTGSGTQPLPVNLLSFDASKQGSKGLLNWKVSNEIGLQRFDIQRSKDGLQYLAIGDLPANNDRTGQYSFTDAQPIAGVNYYRLRLLDRNGRVNYSAVRKLDFNNSGVDVTLYPNPVKDGKLFLATSAAATNAELFDAAGKLVRRFTLNGRSNDLLVTGLAKGVYQLKIFTVLATHTEKLFIQ